jgi:hypothetical protein
LLELLKKESLPEGMFDIIINGRSHGPDYNGFMKLVSTSEMKDKNIILNVINSKGDYAKREQEIQNMLIMYPALDSISEKLERAEITFSFYDHNFQFNRRSYIEICLFC